MTNHCTVTATTAQPAPTMAEIQAACGKAACSLWWEAAHGWQASAQCMRLCKPNSWEQPAGAVACAGCGTPPRTVPSGVWSHSKRLPPCWMMNMLHGRMKVGERLWHRWHACPATGSSRLHLLTSLAFRAACSICAAQGTPTAAAPLNALQPAPQPPAAAIPDDKRGGIHKQRQHVVGTVVGAWRAQHRGAQHRKQHQRQAAGEEGGEDPAQQDGRHPLRQTAWQGDGEG